MSEIRRAVVCDAYKMPRGVARLNEWVTYRIDDSKQTESKILVCPEEFRSAADKSVSAFAIGRRRSRNERWELHEILQYRGWTHFVIVESVVAPAGAPLLFPLKARRAATQVPSASGPDDEGPRAA